MTESLTMSKQVEGVVDAGVTALLHWNEDTNAAVAVKMRSGRLVAEAEAAHHSTEDAYAAATEFEHVDGRLVAAAAAARHSNDGTNAAAVETEQAESRLVAEATATRNRGEDTNAAAALNRG